MEDDKLCLTINDYIVLSDGSRRPYSAIPTQSNFVQKTEDRVGLRQETAEISVNIPIDVLCHVNNENENLRQSSCQRRAPSLPPGKEFHVFFSHSSEDREWVLRMVNKLESPEFGFRCCFADRDFDLGAPVFENVTKYITLSKKTVIVLTPQFLQSPWCTYETRITMEMDLDTKQRLLVPIMLRNCQVPDFIGRLSYIEVDNEHFWDRFLQAIKDEPCETFIQPVGSDAVIPGGPLWFNPDFTSTDIICDAAVDIGSHGFSGTDAYDYVMPNELQRNGMQVTAEDYRAILGILSENRNLMYKGSFVTVLFWIALAIAACAVICASVVASVLSWSLIPLVSLCGAFAAMVLGCVWQFVLIRGITKTWQKTTAQANKIAIRHNMMVSCNAVFKCSIECRQKSICQYTLYNLDHPLDLIREIAVENAPRNDNVFIRNNIVFMYYEWRPCHSYLKRILQNVSEENSGRRRLLSENISPSRPTSLGALENIETQVENLLMHHATEYGQLVLEGRTQCPSEQRHTRQKECLCQFIERSAGVAIVDL